MTLTRSPLNDWRTMFTVSVIRRLRRTFLKPAVVVFLFGPISPVDQKKTPEPQQHDAAAAVLRCGVILRKMGGVWLQRSWMFVAVL